MRTQSLQEESDGPLRIWNCPEPSFIDDALRKQLPSRIMQEFLDFVLRHLIDYPDELILTKLDAPKKTIFRIRLRQSDIGKVVGKHGQTILAIRNLLSAAAARHGEKAILEIVEDEDPNR